MNEQLSKYSSFSIIGAARSGIAAAKLLNSKGYNVFLSDLGNEDKLNQNFLNEIKQNKIPCEFGVHSEKIFENDVLVVSPGVPQNSKVIMEALKRGIDVISEIELASWFCKGKIISITGTNGKTTTTTLIGEIFKDAGFNASVCGNIGTAFADVADNVGKDDVAVVETSSFQLDNIKTFKPYISILLNITPDHLDRYEHNYQNYIDSKMRVFENQTESDFFIYDFDDDIIKKNLMNKVKMQKVPFSIKEDLSKKYLLSAYLKNNNIIYSGEKGEEVIIDSGKLNIKGSHNVYNTLASVSAARIFNIEKDSIQKTLSEFKGVEHRLEFVRELNGIKFYNDSKATNVNSVWYALQGFSEPIILILGGRDKGNDYSEIENEVKKYVKFIIAIGESKEKVYNFFKNIVPVSTAGDLKEAVRIGYKNADKNNIILLSPACASFDMFENYEHRGREFKKIVNEILK